MPRSRERRLSVDRHGRRRQSSSSSPEPYRHSKRQRSGEGQDRDSRRTDYRDRSRSQSRNRGWTKHHRRDRDLLGSNSLRPDRSRSRSPRRRTEGRYNSEERVSQHRRRGHIHEADLSKNDRQSSSQLATGHKQQLHKPLPSQRDAFQGASTAPTSAIPAVEKQQPNFSTTGRLAAESNTVKSADGQAIILKYHEPPEARKPPSSHAWRTYVFKGSEILDTIELSQRSCWLFGREASVVDILIEHPSCSKQHAVFQFRYIEKRNEFGDKIAKVKPYLIDLESANKTTLNGEEIPAGRYLELRNKDVVKFGHSTREFVLQLPP